MSAVGGICTAITHTGARCSSAVASDSNGRCAHHERLARVLALAPKNASTTASISAGATTSTSQQQQYTSSSSVAAVTASTSALSLNLSSSNSSSSSASSSPVPASVNGTYGNSNTTNPAILLPGESVLAAISSSFVFPQTLSLPALPGTLFVTNFRLRFEPANSSLRATGHFHTLLDEAIIGIPRGCVAKLSYPQSTMNGSRAVNRYDYATPSQLVVKFKDLRAWTLGGDVSTLMTTLNRHVFVDSPLNLFAFASSSNIDPEIEACSHRMYDLYADFARMGVDLQKGNAAVRVTDLNKNYTMCPTYPPQLVVPSSMSDREVASVAEFRSKGRLPICCYVHSVSRHSASIWRCAQPKRGILNSQNSTDDRYLTHIGLSNSQHRRIWIADCRPELNARVNNLTGGGTESSNSQHASVTFLNIANIHAMRESMENVRNLVSVGNTDLDFSWAVRVEDTKWLTHVRRVLSGALKVADAVENKGITVLVHCSDGWDRTGQLCGLAQMLLNKHYRTLVGFIDIIEKEWIRVGHKFHDRVGPGKPENDEQSPVFLQFLDCVWQLWRQYPTYFEFNATLLETVADALFSGKYGTFLGNCDRERNAWNLGARTPSLWTHVLNHREQFINPFFREQSDNSLIPPISSVLRNVTLWTEYYFRSSTIPVHPQSNPCAPLWQDKASVPTCRTPQDDLNAAMTAAVRKIQRLEEELRQARASSTVVQITSSSLPLPPPSLPSASMVSPSPTLYQTPASLASTPAQFSSAAPSPTVRPASAPVPLQVPVNGITTTFAMSPSLPLRDGATSSSWTCGICSKVNQATVFQCVVCGRPPPSTLI